MSSHKKKISWGKNEIYNYTPEFSPTIKEYKISPGFQSIDLGEVGSYHINTNNKKKNLFPSIENSKIYKRRKLSKK